MRETTLTQACVAAVESEHARLHAAAIPPLLWQYYCDTPEMLVAVQLTHVLKCVDPS
jgi:hypothetical protein